MKSVAWVVSLFLMAVAACSGNAPQQADAPPAVDAGVDAVDAARVVDVSHSFITLDRTVAKVGLDVIAVKVHVLDINNAPVAGVAVDVSASGSLNSFPVSSLSTNSSGTAVFTWSSTKAEAKEVRAHLLAGDVAPIGATWVAGAPASMAFRNSPGPRLPTATTPVVAVDFFDEFANPTLPASPPTLSLIGGPPNVYLQPSSPTFDGTGVTYSELHIDTVGQGYQLVATFSGGTIAPVPSPMFDVIMGDPDAAHSELRAIAATAQADGQDYSLLSATIRNAVGLPLPNTSVTVTVAGGGTTLSDVMGTTDASGVFSTQLRATTEGTKNITVNVGAIMENASVEFFPATCTPKLPWSETFGTGSVAALKVVDLDGNGTDDIVALFDPQFTSLSSETATPILAVRSKGDGRNFAPQEVRIAGEVRSIGVGDLTGDAKADVVAVALRSSAFGTSLYRVVLAGLGDGRFGAEQAELLMSSSFNLVRGPESIAIRDIDGDGKNDLLWVINQQPGVSYDLAYLRGNGNGTFAPAVVLRSSSFGMGFRVSDLNNDGKLDLYIGDGSIYTRLGNGDGTFRSEVQVPVTESLSDSLVLTDVNGDNFPDVVGSQVWTGRGNGSFLRRSTQMITPPFAVRDMDGDGKLDAVGYFGAQQGGIGFQMWRGDGTGLFPQTGYSDALAPVVQQAVALNWNGDGRPDIVVGGTGVTIIVNNGSGGLIAPTLVAANLDYLLVPPRDFTGDGVADVIGQDLSNGVVLFTGTATGGISTSRRYVSRSVEFGSSTSATSADFTGDGAADILIGSELAVNSGTGTLVPQAEQAIGGGSYLQADLNADGKKDIAWQGFGDTRITFAINTGNGVFASLGEIALPAYGFQTKFVVADMNNDGASDIAVAHNTNASPLAWQYEVWLNQGSGTFAQSITGALDQRPYQLIPGDFDADGLADVVVVGETFEFVKNLGNGQFATPTSSGLPIETAAADLYAWQALDFDLDGKLDIVDTNCRLFFWHGFGNGTFRRPRVFTEASTDRCLNNGFVDRNGDNRGDLLTRYAKFTPYTYASALQTCVMEALN